MYCPGAIGTSTASASITWTTSSATAPPLVKASSFTYSIRGMPKQARTFEWCAGLGFGGFSLLEAGLTETLCLADINSQAVDACRRSIKDNALATRAKCTNPIISQTFLNPSNGTLLLAIRRGSRSSTLGDTLLT